MVKERGRTNKQARFDGNGRGLLTLALGCGWLSACGHGTTRAEWNDWTAACAHYGEKAEVFATPVAAAPYATDIVSREIDRATGAVRQTGHDFTYCLSEMSCSRHPLPEAPRYVMMYSETGLMERGQSRTGRTISIDHREMVDRSTGQVMARSTQLTMILPDTAMSEFASHLMWSKGGGSAVHCGGVFLLRDVFKTIRHT